MASILFSGKPWYQFTLGEIETSVGLFRVLLSLISGILLAVLFPQAGLGGFFAAYAVVNILGVALVRLRFDANDEVIDAGSIAMAANKPALATLFLTWIVTHNVYSAFA